MITTYGIGVSLLLGMFLGSLCNTWAWRIIGKNAMPGYSFFVDLLCGIYFVTIFLRWGWSWQLVQYWVLGCVLCVLSQVDLHTFVLPDKLVLAVALSAGFRVPAEGLGALADGLVGALAIGAPLVLFVLVADMVVGQETMGGGDIKLFAALGFHFGAMQMLLLLMLSCIIGIIFAITQQLQKKAMPFGPSIALAAWITAVMGTQILEWYIGLF